MNISNEIVRLRSSRGLTQEALAEVLGVSRQAVAKWERGEAIPEIEKLVMISDRFGVSLDSLIRGTSAYTVQADRVSGEETAGLIEFLCRAKKRTYAGKGAETVSSRSGSHDLAYEEGPMVYLDSYFGGERFSGEEILWSSDVPVWSMNYTGRVLDDAFSGDFLKECLLAVTHESPIRGPGLYSRGDYTYRCSVNGSFSWFSGEEEIYAGQKRVYECLFHGGSIR